MYMRIYTCIHEYLLVSFSTYVCIYTHMMCVCVCFSVWDETVETLNDDGPRFEVQLSHKVSFTKPNPQQQQPECPMPCLRVFRSPRLLVTVESHGRGAKNSFRRGVGCCFSFFELRGIGDTHFRSWEWEVEAEGCLFAVCNSGSCQKQSVFGVSGVPLWLKHCTRPSRSVCPPAEI